jgi:AraC-like DNA-binding protein
MDRVTVDAPRQAIRFSTADSDPTDGAFARLRNASADLVSLTMLGSRDRFRFDVSILPLGGAALLDCEIGALGCHRTAGQVARSAFDGFLVSLQLSGGFTLFCGSRIATVGAGDICLIDMAGTAQARVTEPADGGPVRLVAFALPRSLLAPLLAVPACVHGLVISADTHYRRLLADHMVALRSSAPQLADRESDAAIEALARLVAGSVAGSMHARQTASVANDQVLVSAIKSYIDARLGSASLGIDALCQKFRLSRATLYRKFEADGGPGTYIQLRRLHRAMAMLVSPAFRHWRIIDIAVECQFGSDVAFIRAFRRLFGVTPGSVRADPDKYRPAEPAPERETSGAPWRFEAGSAGRFAVRPAPSDLPVGS